MGVVGKDYHVVKNIDAFSFFDAITGSDSGVYYETAGALGKGERVFITAKLPDYIRVGRDDLIEQYLFLTTSHDGSGSITAAFTPVRVVCQNTLNAALKNVSNCIKIRHTKSAKERLQQAHQLMGISSVLSNRLEETFDRWAKVRITDKEVLLLIKQAMAPNKEVLEQITQGVQDEFSTRFQNTIEKIALYAFENETQQLLTTKGTLFGAYNAISGYYQNIKEYRNAEEKLRTIVFGSGQQRSQTAFNLCTGYENK